MSDDRDHDPEAGEPRDVDHLPDVYLTFRDRHPAVADALDRLGAAADESGPLDARERRLVTLGVAVGAVSQGAVRSNVRKALDLGVSEDEIRHVIALSVSTRGFPAAVAAFGWVEEVLAEEA